MIHVKFSHWKAAKGKYKTKKKETVEKFFPKF